MEQAPSGLAVPWLHAGWQRGLAVPAQVGGLHAVTAWRDELVRFGKQ